ncbi:hypothetical protein [Enterobacter hormaechei]|uniref:hypothetical protein n=1 Tax=Enterobacter hormaechei TaxID=158836 RepID=UPI0034D1C539
MISLESFSNIRDPKFSDDSGYQIDIIADIDGIGQDIPFTASFNDSETYGHELYEAALNGQYGPVLPFISTIEHDVVARQLRDGFIRATDPMVITDYTIDDIYLSTEQRQELFDTRLAFKKWPKQEGWPRIPLPSVPEWIKEELANRNYSIPSWEQEQ